MAKTTALSYQVLWTIAGPKGLKAGSKQNVITKAGKVKSVQIVAHVAEESGKHLYTFVPVKGE